MSKQGNIIFSANPKSSGGAGVLTLDNGLTLTGTNGQLGGTLIKNTSISGFGSYSFELTFTTTLRLASAGASLSLDSTNAFLSSGSGSIILEVSSSTSGIDLHNFFEEQHVTLSNRQFSFSSNTAGILMVLDYNAMQFEIGNITASKQLFINSISGVYHLGNVTAKKGVHVNETANTYYFGENTTGVSLTIDNANELVNFDFAGVTKFKLDHVNDLYAMGDIVLQTGLSMDVANGNYFFGDWLGQNCLEIDINNTNYYFGSRVDSFILLSADTKHPNLQYLFNTTLRGLYISPKDNIFQMGDIDGFNAGSMIQIDDAAQTALLQANNGVITSQPSGNGSGAFLMGKVIAGAVAPDAANYLEIMIDGVLRKIIIAS